MPYRKIEDAERDAIVADYEGGMSLKQLWRKHGSVYQTCKRILLRSGVQLRENVSTRIYPVDETAFASDREPNAYWTGFLMADGCVSDTGKTPYVILALQESDRHHVEAFRTFLKSELPIYTRDNRNHQRQVRFSVASRRMAADLAHWGVVPRKSLVAKAINGIEHNRHFWRGCVDGDGSVGTHHGYGWIGLHGSQSLVQQFASFCGQPFGETPPIDRHGSIWRCRLTGIRATVTMLRLYGGCSIALARKADVAAQCVADYMARPHPRGAGLSNW